MNPADYLKAGDSYTASNAASSGDLASFQGLQALLGGASNPNQSQQVQALQNIFGVNGAPTSADQRVNPYSFNSAGFQSALNSGKTNEQAAYKDLTYSTAPNQIGNNAASGGGTYLKDTPVASSGDPAKDIQALQSALPYYSGNQGVTDAINRDINALNNLINQYGLGGGVKVGSNLPMKTVAKR